MQNPPETESGKQDSIEEDEEDFDEEAVMIREEKEKVPTEAERFCSPTVESLALRGDREEATGGGGVDRVGAGEHGADKGCGLWVGGWEAGPSLQLGARCHHAVVLPRPNATYPRDKPCLTLLHADALPSDALYVDEKVLHAGGGCG